MHSSEEHLETILCRLCELISRWDPDRRELENLPDQPEMLDLMLMKNETELYFHPNNAMDKALLLLNVNPGLRKVTESDYLNIFPHFVSQSGYLGNFGACRKLLRNSPETCDQ